MFVVDTNILVYAADRRAPEHAHCKTAVEKWRTETTPWYLTWSICFEFMRVVTHRSVLNEPWSTANAWNFLQALFATQSLGVLIPGDRHASVINDMLRDFPFIAGNDVFDMGIAALMREHGIRTIYTRDTGFHRFPFLDVIDPTQG